MFWICSGRLWVDGVGFFVKVVKILVVYLGYIIIVLLWVLGIYNLESVFFVVVIVVNNVYCMAVVVMYVIVVLGRFLKWLFYYILYEGVVDYYIDDYWIVLGNMLFDVVEVCFVIGSVYW